MFDSLSKAKTAGGGAGVKLPPGEPLEDYDVAFLEHLKAEAETASGPPAVDETLRKRLGELMERYVREGPPRTRSEVYAFDRLLAENVAPGELCAEAPSLYLRYCADHGIAPDPNDPMMQAAKAGAADDPKLVEGVRARMLNVLRALHWSYTFGPLREKRRVKLIEEAMWLMVVATLVLALFLLAMRMTDSGRGHPFFAVLATVVYAGVMGGAVSCTRRLGAVPTKSDALGSIHALKNSRYVLYFAPLTGAVFAVVTMLLFMGDVLRGVAFPTFPEVLGGAPVNGEWDFTHALLPAGSKDYALLFLWCFIAGFAERFIPDTLGHLTERAGSQGKTAAESGTK
ncbi:MAG: hypothetical protein JST11_19670 [Acidobacteria bacterium]|nr:hypothetical protein [Acidobacteriota bacterium]